MKNILPEDRVLIIAEAGVNHNGRLDLALKLVDAAVDAGADAVKFQAFKAENLVSPKALLVRYQRQADTKSLRTQFDLIKQLELEFVQLQRIKDHCAQRKIMFLSTPFDMETVDSLIKLKVPAFKISSGDVTNLPFLRYIAQKKKSIILSTGMADITEIEEAVNTIFQAGNQQLTLLHCVTEYPAPYGEVNLKAMLTLASTFKLPVGYSDHTLGIEVALAAVALGARVLEKHLTLSRDLQGPDHRSSLEPREFREMVQGIRHVTQALGDGIKKAAKSERKNRDMVRRSIVAVKNIPAGAVISKDDIAIKRPGYGIAPKYWEKIIGTETLSYIRKEDVLLWEHLAPPRKGRSAL